MQERKKTIVKTRTVRKKDGTIHKIQTVKKVSKHVDHKNDKRLQYALTGHRKGSDVAHCLELNV
jgi:hypothetical protein